MVSEVGFCWFCHFVPQRTSNLVPRTPSSDYCGLTMAGRGQGIPVARGRARPVPIRTEHVMTRNMARARANINNVEDSIAANDPDLEVLTGANGSDPRSSEESGSESAFENVDGGQPAGLTSTPSSPTITRQPDDYVCRRDFEVLQRRIDSLVDYLHTNNRTPRVRRRLPQTPDVSSRISPRQNVVDSGVVAGNQDGRCQQDPARISGQHYQQNVVNLRDLTWDFHRPHRDSGSVSSLRTASWVTGQRITASQYPEVHVYQDRPVPRQENVRSSVAVVTLAEGQSVACGMASVSAVPGQNIWPSVRGVVSAEMPTTTCRRTTVSLLPCMEGAWPSVPVVTSAPMPAVATYRMANVSMSSTLNTVTSMAPIMSAVPLPTTVVSVRADNEPMCVLSKTSAVEFKRDVKLKCYSGESDVEQFLTQFKMAAKLGQWPEDQQGAILATLLQGNARRLLPTDPSAPVPTFNELSCQLRARFGTEAEPSYFVTLLNTRVRREKEGLNELKLAIIELSEKAYLDVKIESRRVLVIEPFVRALTDPEQRKAVRMARPKSIDEAVQAAVTFESAARTESRQEKANPRRVRAIAETVPSDISVERNEGKKNKKSKNQNKVNAGGAQAETRAVMPMVAPVTAQPAIQDDVLKSLVTAITQLTNKVENIEQRAQQGRNFRPPSQPPMSAQGSYTGMLQTPRFPPGTCYACGDPSHWKNECPHQRRPVQSPMNGTAVRPGNGTTASQRQLSENYRGRCPPGQSSDQQ